MRSSSRATNPIPTAKHQRCAQARLRRLWLVFKANRVPESGIRRPAHPAAPADARAEMPLRQTQIGQRRQPQRRIQVGLKPERTDHVRDQRLVGQRDLLAVRVRTREAACTGFVQPRFDRSRARVEPLANPLQPSYTGR